MRECLCLRAVHDRGAGGGAFGRGGGGGAAGGDEPGAVLVVEGTAEGNQRDRPTWSFPGLAWAGQTDETWVDGSARDVLVSVSSTIEQGVAAGGSEILEQSVFKSEKDPRRKTPGERLGPEEAMGDLVEKRTTLRENVERVECDASEDGLHRHVCCPPKNRG